MRKQSPLTLNQIAEIRARYKAKDGTNKQIASDYNISPTYLYKLLQDKRYDSAETEALKVLEVKQREDLVARMSIIREKLMAKFETIVNNLDEKKIAKKVTVNMLTDLYDKLSRDIQLLKGQPTEITETRKLEATVDINKLLDKNSEDISKILLDGFDDKKKVGTTFEVEVLDGNTQEQGVQSENCPQVM